MNIKIPEAPPVKRLYRFQQSRSEPPSSAERYDMRSFQITRKIKSKIVNGLSLNKVDGIGCPVCQTLLKIEHGDRLQCRCGLFLELYGISLDIWENEDEK